MKLTIITLAILLFGNAAFGQSVMEIESKYGKPISVYSVSDSIWMSPEFAPNGEVCRIRLFPKRFASDTTYLFKELPSLELENVLGRLVPLNTRGSVKEPFGTTTTGGNSIWSTYNFEKISFVFSASISAESGANKEIETFVLSKKAVIADADQNSPTLRDIPLRSDFKFEVVTIKWNKPACKDQ